MYVCVRSDQDSVRLLAVESCGPFAQKLVAEDNYRMLLPIVQKLAQVRYRANEMSCRRWCVVLSLSG